MVCVVCVDCVDCVGCPLCVDCPLCVECLVCDLPSVGVADLDANGTACVGVPGVVGVIDEVVDPAIDPTLDPVGIWDINLRGVGSIIGIGVCAEYWFWLISKSTSS